MLNDYDELNEMQLDVLKEIGNIGAGNAATALATILNDKVDITVPTIKIVGFDETMEILGGHEKLAIGVLIDFCGDENIRGMMMFLIDYEDAKSITNILMQNDDTDELTEIKLSAIEEIGNIMSASYINCISVMTGLKINMSIPSLAIDMIGALVEVPVIEFGSIGDKVLFIEEKFVGEQNNLSSNMILFAEMDTLKIVMNRLGLEI